MARRLALFDFDGTLIRGDSIAAFVRRLFLEKKMRLPLLMKVLWKTVQWRLGLCPVERVKSLALSPLARMNQADAQAFCREFALLELYPRMYQDGLAALQSHADAGDLVLLVSASPEVYLRYLLEKLPVDAVLGTQVDAGFKVTRNAVREEKCAMIHHWLNTQGIQADWAQSAAYGDSANDLPMLNMVGKPTLVNPHHKAKRLGAGIQQVHWQ